MTRRRKIFIFVGLVVSGILWACARRRRRGATPSRSFEFARYESPPWLQTEESNQAVNVVPCDDLAADGHIEADVPRLDDQTPEPDTSIKDDLSEPSQSVVLFETEGDKQVLDPAIKQAATDAALTSTQTQAGESDHHQEHTNREHSTGMTPEFEGRAPRTPVRRTIDPAKRGGRPREAEDVVDVPPVSGNKASQRPEIVCFQRGREWFLAVDLPSRTEAVGCKQNDVPLDKHDADGDIRWILREGHGKIQVEFSDTGSWRIDLGSPSHNCLLFRLTGEDQKRGRRVLNPTSGAYLLVVPDSWKRLNGGTASEPVSLARCAAYYVVLDRDGLSEVAFERPEGEVFKVQSRAITFDIVGEHSIQTGDDLGPLFVQEPPRIRAKDPQIWESITSIVIGQEGLGIGKWRTTFQPMPGQVEQLLPVKVGEGQGGWFFLRFYGADNSLFDSMDFRWIRDIREIRVTPSFPLPEQNGHVPARIEVRHTADCRINPEKEPRGLALENNDSLTIATIPPSPGTDLSYWRVRLPDGRNVRFALLVERIWWTVGSDESSSSQHWTDKPVELVRSDFFATSDKQVSILFPKPGWTDRVLVGFSPAKWRYYRVPKHRSLSIPLREFGDSPEIDRGGVAELRLWLTGGTPETSAALVRIAALPIADSVPQPPLEADIFRPPVPFRRAIDRDRATCSNCDHAQRSRGGMIVRCARRHWPLVFSDEFERRHGRDSCGEWSGEYMEEDGAWSSDYD